MIIPENSRRRIETLRRSLTRWGLDTHRAVSAARGSGLVRKERLAFEKQRLASGHPEEFPVGRSYPIYEDRFSDAGIASGHYFHQDLLVARAIHDRAPRRHIDVGSSIYGFVSHVASFRDIEVLDVRPVHSVVPGIRFVQQDVMHLDTEYEGITDSVSCLHALEHFGLGRYGDAVDYDGWRKGLDGLARMLEPHGTLYLSVPTGERQRVEFNAHRVFSLPFLREELNRDFVVEHLAFVTDSGDLIPNLDPHGPEAEHGCGADYGCSIWTLRKR